MPDLHDIRPQRTKKVLVTGGSGFIGGHIARYFVNQGLDVACLVREKSDTRYINDQPLKFITGDITDLKSVLAACKDMDAVVHTAAKVGDWGDYREFYEVNVTGTENVLNAALNNKVPKVILTGSVSSYGEEDYPGLKDESSPFNSHYKYFLDGCLPSGMNHYRDTKAACTAKAGEIAGQHNMDVIVMEPVWVYGENEFSSGFYEYLESLKSGMPFMPGSRTNQFHVIYAADLARAYYHAFMSDLKGFHRIIIGNTAT